MLRTVISTAIVAFPPLAWADPGDHLRAGSVEITPSVDIGGEYRTNVYRSEDGSIPAANLRVAPRLSVARPGEDHDVRLMGEWELRKYLFEGTAPTLPATAPNSASNLDRFDEFAVSGGTSLFKRSAIGLRLSEEVRLVNFRADAEYADIPYSSNLRNHVRGAVRLNPGSALELSPGGGWTYDSYRVPGMNEGDRTLNARNTYGPLVEARWTFLPRTAVLASAEYMMVRWDTNAFQVVADDADNDPIALPNSHQAKANVGLDGRLTERISAQILFGYGEARFDEASTVLADPTGSGTDVPAGAGQDAAGSDGFLFQGQVRYSFTPKSDEGRGNSLGAGYVRDFESSFFTNYVQLDKLFVDFQARFGRLEPSIRYEIRFEDYSGGISRTDRVNKTNADVRLKITEWASFSTGAWFQQRASTDAEVEYSDFNLQALATLQY